MAQQQALNVSRTRVNRTNWAPIIQTALFVFVALIIVAPLSMVLLGGFNDAGPFEAFRFGFSHWSEAWRDGDVGAALQNTFTITALRGVLGFAIAIPLAWLVARTNVPGARYLEFGFWIAFFMPPLASVQGWIFLLGYPRGLLHQLILHTFPDFDTSWMDIYSYWGIVLVHLMAQNVSALFVLLVISFRKMDSSLEEAARISGATKWRTLRQIVLPLSRPMIAMLVVLTVIRGMQSYEIETVLGKPVNINVFSTLIVNMISDEPPRLAQASALSTFLMLILVPLILFQRIYVGRHQYATVGSKMRTAAVDLKGWRWAAFALVLVFVLLQTLIPLLGTLAASLMKRSGFFFIDHPWTLKWWGAVLSNTSFLSSLKTTTMLGLWAGLGSAVASFAVAYVMVRTKFRARAALDFVTWLPWAVPGALLSFGVLSFVLSNPISRDLHGTIFILVLVMIMFRFPLGVHLLKSGLMQINRELEEASLICGANRVKTQFRIIAPLLTPMMIAVALMTFVAAVTEVSGVILLASTNTQTLSLLSLGYLTGRDASTEAAAVVTCVMVMLSIGVALISRAFGIRLGEASAGAEARAH